jgi:hypothetical protein
MTVNCCGAYVCFWHKADIPRLFRCPLSGAKRTFVQRALGAFHAASKSSSARVTTKLMALVRSNQRQVRLTCHRTATSVSRFASAVSSCRCRTLYWYKEAIGPPMILNRPCAVRRRPGEPDRRGHVTPPVPAGNRTGAGMLSANDH